MKKVITIAILIVVILSFFFIKINYKNLKFGNNNSNIKSADKIKKYILGITSYQTSAEITINSNKNTNIYKIKEQYLKEDNICKTEIIEPENIKRNKYNLRRNKSKNRKFKITGRIFISKL